MARTPVTPDAESKSETKAKYRGYTEAQARAGKKWNEKQAQIAIRVRPEIKAMLDAHIATTGESLAGFIVRASTAQIERDGGKVEDLSKLEDL